VLKINCFTWINCFMCFYACFYSKYLCDKIGICVRNLFVYLHVLFNVRSYAMQINLIKYAIRDLFDNLYKIACFNVLISF
jgi:hypothetical protein